MRELFTFYTPGTNYQLNSLVEFEVLPDELKPLYTVAMEKLLAVYEIGRSDEPLVPLGPLSDQYRLHIHNASGTTPTGAAVGEIWVRKSAAKKLIQVTRTIHQQNPHLALWITDGYRSLALQRQHFQWITAQVKKEGFLGKELYDRTCQFIADPAVFAPHSTGGVLDLTIYDRRTQQPIDMGTTVDAIEVPLIHSWYNMLTKQQQDNRLLLYKAMTAVGFVNTPLEWWHYSYGDLEWALHTGHGSTIYSSIDIQPSDMILSIAPS